MADEPQPTNRKPRSKSGCQTCRARKIRCDERPEVCLNCEKLGLPCGGITTSPSTSKHEREPSDSPANAGVKRKRTFRSCKECRATKTRCSGDKPACGRCRKQQRQCNYEDQSEPAWQQQLRAAAVLQASSLNGSPSLQNVESHRWSASPSEERETRPGQPGSRQYTGNEDWLMSQHLPDSERVRLLVEYYFANIHPLRCFGFLHKPSFMQRLDAEDARGRDDDALLLIVSPMQYRQAHSTLPSTS